LLEYGWLKSHFYIKIEKYKVIFDRAILSFAILKRSVSLSGNILIHATILTIFLLSFIKNFELAVYITAKRNERIDLKHKESNFLTNGK
jgi:hypothetical protein